MDKGQLLITYDDVLGFYQNKTRGVANMEKYRHLFPVSGSARLSGVVADLMGDGHLQGWKKWRFDYTYKKKSEGERFEGEMLDLFGVRGKARPCRTNRFSETYNYGVNRKPLAVIMYLSGVPVGNKVLNKYGIPGWILGNRENFRTFSRRFFSCEGTCWGGKSPGVRIELWKEERIMQDMVEMLESYSSKLDEHFGIRTTKVFAVSHRNARKDGNVTRGLRIQIKRKDSIIKFRREVGFEDDEKTKRLDAVVSGFSGLGR